MDTYIVSIEKFINDIHIDLPVIEEVKEEIKQEPVNIITDEIVLDKQTLDMKILRQRMDSVSVIQYYRDLKNDRLKLNEQIDYMDSEKDMNDFMNSNMNNKPWPRMDNYTKQKKITEFVFRLLDAKKIQDADEVLTIFKTMLKDKKITKKNIQFDSSNNIISLGDYSL